MAYGLGRKAKGNFEHNEKAPCYFGNIDFGFSSFPYAMFEKKEKYCHFLLILFLKMPLNINGRKRYWQKDIEI